jgi:hypothetical protein
MANLPVRNLGGVGVITDVSPYDLPPNAFSRAENVLFSKGKVIRSPVYKDLFSVYSSAVSYDDLEETLEFNQAEDTYNSIGGSSVFDLRFITSYLTPGETEVVLVANKTGAIQHYPSGVIEDITNGGDLINNEEPWTHAQIGGISFLGRGGMIPLGRNLISDDVYGYLSEDESSEWNSEDTCAVVRAYLDYLICLNVTKGSDDYPTMVKWSDPIQYGQSVASIKWDPANPENIAGENILAELKTPIKDGMVLGNSFIIYAEDQVYLMEYTGSSFVFNFRRLFPTTGIMNTNCVVEVEGKHFVFGGDDIYVHDGVTKKSISDGRIRSKVFDTIDLSKKSRCFVHHNSKQNLIYFAYVSKESNIGFPDTVFCNRAAVFNYSNDTWSFVDLPNIVGATELSVNTSDNLYRDVAPSYSELNTSYANFTESSPIISTVLSIIDEANNIPTTAVLVTDDSTDGQFVAPIIQEVNKPCFVERVGIDVDGGETNLPLRNYKTVQSMIPQFTFFNVDDVARFEIGASDLSNQDVRWDTAFDFDPKQEYKVDTKAAGRYLAYRVSVDSYSSFAFSGFDAEVISTSRR